jgi:hypothetical protein
MENMLVEFGGALPLDRFQDIERRPCRIVQMNAARRRPFGDQRKPCNLSSQHGWRVLTFNIAAAVSWEVGKFADLSSEGDATMILIGFRHGLRVSETRGAPFGLWQGGP